MKILENLDTIQICEDCRTICFTNKDKCGECRSDNWIVYERELDEDICESCYAEWRYCDC